MVAIIVKLHLLLVSWCCYTSLILQVDRVIFCVFLNVDYKIYQRLLYYYFPPETPDESEGTSHIEKLRVGSSVLIVY